MFEKNYPNLSEWVNSRGWIELGSDEESDSWIRVLDMGGMVWEDNGSDSLEDALKAAEKFLVNEL